MVAYLLLRWLEDYGADLHGEYFPFDLPSLAFYRRGRQVYDWLVKVTGAADFPQKELSTLGDDHPTPRTPCGKMRRWSRPRNVWKRQRRLFEELRGLLRLTSDPHGPVLHRRVPADAPAIAAEKEKSFHAWKNQLRQRLAAGT